MSKTFYHESGKGSHTRVRDVDAETYSNNWEKIFGKKMSDEKKLEIFNENKVENFKASTELEKNICDSCKGEKGVFDCGWWYSCQQCFSHIHTGSNGQPLK